MEENLIVQKLWSLCNVLRDDGITFHQYVNELTYLLFLKMADEKGVEEDLPEGYRWSDLCQRQGNEQFDFYRTQLVLLGTQGHDAVRAIFANPTSLLRHAESLNILVERINSLDWYSAKLEGFGDLYEGLLAKNAGEKKSGAGQYFTPRPLIDSMVQCMRPTVQDSIQDPAAGTGGFLVSAQQFILAQRSLKAKPHKEATFLGMEHVQDVHRLALMNLLLHGMPYSVGNTGIQYGDALGPAGEKMAEQGATLILTNPPFGTKRGGGLPSRKDLPFPTSNKQLAFLQHIYLSLTPGGRAAVVLPDNVLFEGNIGLEVRRDLMERCNLHTILRLPTGIFYAQGVKTNVLFFTKASMTAPRPTERVWIYDLRTSMPQFGKRTQLMREHFATFEAAYGDDPNGTSNRGDVTDERFRSFSRTDIMERGDRLDFMWLRDGEQPLADDEAEPLMLAQEIATDVELALEDLRQVLSLLGGEAAIVD